ncbi:hypothetical protein CDES_05580 [Corynebacterium deserti GIMN1.010]|uniref:Uncharacterized protein n=1 Tax=Corynebacterium deserti GIMN1.010 TaxID=931089 RepID=A0A0M4CFJ2_9CORY|nr:hypothetical protein CDES_05580 [Corynebacterium deserti GIMN1.010]
MINSGKLFGLIESGGDALSTVQAIFFIKDCGNPGSKHNIGTSSYETTCVGSFPFVKR